MKINLNIKKIKEEDRRFLLNRFLTETITSHQGSMYNTQIILSLLALAISCFSVVYLTRNLWIILVYCIFALVGLGWYIKKYKETQLKLKEERDNIGLTYDELFKYHLNYASKKGKND